MHSQYAPVAPPAAALTVEDLSVVFARDGKLQRVLDGLGFALAPGEIGCLLGASGCGKSTALRAIAGFVRPERGTVRIGDRTVVGPGAWVVPEARSTGVVFQDYALFPHLDIAANVAFGLRGRSAPEREARVDEMLHLVGLDGMRRRFPHELSGGQQQRVALARALAPAPSLLLLDEPFSSLDPELRERLALELRELLKAAAITTLLVTHDQHEAFAMADSVGVMIDGRIAQWDTPTGSITARPRARLQISSVTARFSPGGFGKRRAKRRSKSNWARCQSLRAAIRRSPQRWPHPAVR